MGRSELQYAATTPGSSYPDLSPSVPGGGAPGQGGDQVAASDPNWGSYTQLAAAAGYSGTGQDRLTLSSPADDAAAAKDSQATQVRDRIAYMQTTIDQMKAMLNGGSGSGTGEISASTMYAAGYGDVRDTSPMPMPAPVQVGPEDFTPVTLSPIDFQPIDIQVASAPSTPAGTSPAVPDTGHVWQPIVGGSVGLGLTNNSVATPMPANPRLPVNNGTWTNPSRPGNSGWLSTDPRVNAVTGGKPVPFRNNMVDFSPWSQGRVPVPGMTGNSTTDLRLGRDALRTQLNLPSDAAVQRWLKSNGVTLHHDANGVALDMIPSPLHNNVPHTGGASILRNWDYSLGSPANFVTANRIAAGGRYLGVAGMAYGAVVDGQSLVTQYQISKQTGSYSNFAAEGIRVAGGWGGAWVAGTAGAEFGAGFGSVFGPVGTVVGGLVGGVVGGALGYAGGSYAAPEVASDLGLLPGQGG